MKKQPSLKRPLILQPLLFQFFTLLVSFVVILALLIRIDSGGHYTDQEVTGIAAQAVTRRDNGSLAVRMTPDLQSLLKVAPNTWFVARDTQGRSISFGPVPRQYASVVEHLEQLSFGDIRGRFAPYQLSVVIRRHTGPAGELTILGHGKINAVSLMLALAANLALIPIFLLLALGSALITPWIVRRSLAGVSRIAREAERIDVDRRGIRLTEMEVPREIGPLVRAVNDALSRLDDGYERQRRFIASAAHELRTPIAILKVKIDAAGDNTAKALQADVARLSTLAEQLLDLHRLDGEAIHDTVDLGALARRVVADLAPLLIATDNAIEVVVEEHRPIVGNAGAIERVLTNLIQNAVEHGGRHVIVRVCDTSLEVEDDGPGIPAEERGRVFEPFHRIKPRQTGAGLGLNLVQQVVARHNGNVTILEAPSGGALVRVAFPRQT